MASDERVGWALAVLKHLPSKNPVTAETVAFYALGLADLSDEELTAAVGIAASRSTFLPTPAELRGLVGANRPVFVDPEPVLAAIAAMASYLPTSGTTYPRVEAVRLSLGDAVAEAYGLAGGARVFSGNDITRDIARREFGEALRDVVQAYGAGAVLAPVAAQKALPSGGAVVVFGERSEGRREPQRLGAVVPKLLPRGSE